MTMQEGMAGRDEEGETKCETGSDGGENGHARDKGHHRWGARENWDTSAGAHAL